jgi:hypothetical protein
MIKGILKHSISKGELAGSKYQEDFEKLSMAKLKIIDTFTSNVNGVFKTNFYIEVDSELDILAVINEMSGEWIFHKNEVFMKPKIGYTIDDFE